MKYVITAMDGVVYLNDNFEQTRNISFAKKFTTEREAYAVVRKFSNSKVAMKVWPFGINHNVITRRVYSDIIHSKKRGDIRGRSTSFEFDDHNHNG